jgi:hypothetical protein
MDVVTTGICNVQDDKEAQSWTCIHALGQECLLVRNGPGCVDWGKIVISQCLWLSSQR